LQEGLTAQIKESITRISPRADRYAQEVSPGGLSTSAVLIDHDVQPDTRDDSPPAKESDPRPDAEGSVTPGGANVMTPDFQALLQGVDVTQLKAFVELQATAQDLTQTALGKEIQKVRAECHLQPT
jgi:hypothetical protein